MSIVQKSVIQYKGCLPLESKCRDRELMLDFASELGGSGQALSPVQGLLASLGACLLCTLRQRIENKDLSLSLTGHLDIGQCCLGEGPAILTQMDVLIKYNPPLTVKAFLEPLVHLRPEPL